MPAIEGRLDSCDEAKIGVGLSIFTRFDLSAEFMNVGQRLSIPLEKAIRFRKLFVLNADGCNFALLQFTDQPLHVIEIAIAGIPILSRTPNCAEIANPLAHIPAKPASSTICVRSSRCVPRKEIRSALKREVSEIRKIEKVQPCEA